MLLSLLLVSLLGDVAPRRPAEPSRPPAECRVDGDCVLSTFQGCCGSCCPVAPHAVPASTMEGAKCAAIDCAQQDCSLVRCRAAPPVDAFVPACRAGRCVAVPREAPALQCRIDADCRAVTSLPPPGDACHRSPCGCCPVTQAVPADAVVPLRQQPGPPSKQPAPEKPTFGLSSGQSGLPPPERPACSPCPQPASGTAACNGGRCVLQSLPRPRPFPPPRG